MAENIKTIGVLTSGGDAPGMNAAVRAVVRAGISKGLRVMGIQGGYVGLINGDIYEMDRRCVSDIIQIGGTMLYTARSTEFKTEEGMQKAVKTCKDFGIDGLVVIGGDGSFRGASDLSKRGVLCVGIPGTIDNDIQSSTYTIGFDTAVNTVIDLVDKLRDTAQSHHRCSIVEVMGAKAGYIALYSGIAAGASVVIVPEVPLDFKKDVVDKILDMKKSGKKHFIIIVAEGAEIKSTEVSRRLFEETGIESRTTILGHLQRGGTPTARDRVIGTRMGYHAVHLLSQGIGDRVVVYNNSNVIDFDIQEALKMKKVFDKDLYELSKIVSS